MATFKHIPVDQIQYLANAMFSKLKTWCNNSFLGKTANAASATKLQTARTINGVGFNGSANITVKANPTENALTNEDLNNIKTQNAFYYAAGGNTVTNKPSGVEHFGLIVMHSAAGWYQQILVVGQTYYVRCYNASTWSSWDKLYSVANKPSKSDIGLGNVENKSSATIRGELTKANVTTALGYTPPTTNTTYSAATTSAAGLMSAADKTKLDGIATGATKVTVDSAMSDSSTNPVQNKIAKGYVDTKFKSTVSDVAFALDTDTGCLYYKKTMNS